MSTTLIVYFASIATAVHAFLILHAIALAIAGVIILIDTLSSPGLWSSKKEKDDWATNKPKRIRLAIIIFCLSTLCSVPAALLPFEADVYRIAGVTDQQKATIDASGKILETQKK